MGEVTSAIAWGAIAGAIVGGLAVHMIWKRIRDAQRRTAVATGLAVELSFALREVCDVADAMERGERMLLTMTPPRTVFDKVVGELPELLPRAPLLTALLEVFNRIEDTVHLAQDLKKQSSAVPNPEDWQIYVLFLDWLTVQMDQVLGELELIAFSYVRTPDERYSAVPVDLQTKAVEIRDELREGLRVGEERLQAAATMGSGQDEASEPVTRRRSVSQQD